MNGPQGSTNSRSPSTAHRRARRTSTSSSNFGGNRNRRGSHETRDRAWPRAARPLIACARCGDKASATAGTIVDRTRIPLTGWCHAMWLLTHQKNGASALSLQRHLGLSRDETTWRVLHKLRRAMGRPGRDRLRGLVEVDATYGGGDENDVRGRETYTKSLVGVAAEERGEGVGRILGYDLDAFTFRFNRRTSRSRGKLFYRLVQEAVEVDPVHWRDVAAGQRRPRLHNR